MRRRGQCRESNKLITTSCEPRKASSCGSQRKREAGPVTLTAIISDYIRNYRRNASRELHYFKTQRNLKNAIELAALAKTPEGTRHPHQYRLTKRALASAHRRLLSAKHRIAKCRVFDELITLINKLVRPVYGIGGLYVYDVSTRIGAYLKLYPKHIYLHAGTRDAARAFGLDTSGDRLAMAVLPREFRALKPHEIEDLLCIYKKRLARLCR